MGLARVLYEADSAGAGDRSDLVDPAGLSIEMDRYNAAGR
jgi:hypothetical protein